MTLKIEEAYAIQAYTPTPVGLLEEELICLNSVICKCIDRIDQIEKRIDDMEERFIIFNTLSTKIYKSSERATQLDAVVRHKGFITRGEVMKQLNCHHVSADRAMREAVDLYNDLHLFKNKSGKWILAVKK